MAKSGPKPRPKLELVSGKTPGKRKIMPPTKPKPKRPAEPRWADFLPGRKMEFARRIAREEWQRVMPVLDELGRLSDLEPAVLRDYCVCVARIVHAERVISEVGFGEKSKHPAVTAANQYRQQLRFYVDALGLSQRSREGCAAEGGRDGEDEDLYDT